jgi:succinate dehydrogenase / fumarate reductase cytochrome b subunit
MGESGAARPILRVLMNGEFWPVRSSLGSKYVMALTGVALIAFVVAHMLGNLLIFLGPDALNSYAHSIKDKPALLWTARVGLLVVFVIHLAVGVRLALQNQKARGVAYVYEDTVQASWASRHMLLTGFVLLAFIVFHVAQFTFGVVTSYPAGYRSGGRLGTINYLDLHESVATEGGAAHAAERQDVYRMVISGFREGWVTATYIIAQVFLWLHLRHGASSWFQSLGLNHPGYNPLIRAFGPVLATAVLIGNCSIPLAVLFRVIGGSVP